MTRVLIIQAQMKQYRVPFYTKLHSALLQNGIDLRVIYSNPSLHERDKRDNAVLPPEIGIKVPGYWLLRGRFLYQGLMRQAMAADLVIAEQANKYLHNYALLMLRMLRIKRLALFGHGRNRRHYRSWISELIRPWIARRVAWWFTYTEGTANWLAANGVGREKITVVENSIDTQAFGEQISAVSDPQVQEVRDRLKISPDSRVGIFCGALTADKGIALLLEAAPLVRERIPSFHLLILGAGPERERVESAARQEPWIHYMGPVFGWEKVLLLKISNCFLLPGCVGLAILDSFAAGLPLITTKVPTHGPEIEYLEEGVNGIMTDNNIELYSEAVAEVLSNKALFNCLKTGARRSANRYSIEAMVENFRLGILRCLEALGVSAAEPQSSLVRSRSDRGLSVK